MANETLGTSQAFASIAVDGISVYRQAGLTKREYFAAIALQGILANQLEYDDVAKTALALADALIAELNK